MEYWMMTAIAANRRDDAEDLARLWRPLLFKAAAAALAYCFGALLNWRDRRREQLHLEELSDWVLHDVGLYRLEAEREALKLFRR
jgi:uncharacterized protein YjiS (DUF1127 family)